MWSWLNSAHRNGSAHQWRWDGVGRRAVAGCGEVLPFDRVDELVPVKLGDEPRFPCRACMRAEAKRDHPTEVRLRGGPIPAKVSA